MADVVYVLCAVASTGCAGLLLRSYRRQQTRPLLWSSLGFIALAINNILLAIDLTLLPATELGVARAAFGAAGAMLLVVGVVWER